MLRQKLEMGFQKFKFQISNFLGSRIRGKRLAGCARMAKKAMAKKAKKARLAGCARMAKKATAKKAMAKKATSKKAISKARLRHQLAGVSEKLLQLVDELGDEIDALAALRELVDFADLWAEGLRRGYFNGSDTIGYLRLSDQQ